MATKQQADGVEVDAIVVEVISQSLSGVVQEMQNSLFCTGYSTIIRESRDASCAVIDPDGNVLAQHTVLPLHLGSFPECVANLVAAHGHDLADGDAYVVNHPYHGGSPHATDVAVISPIFVDGELFGFAGSIAHKSDIGGLVPGTNSGRSREIFHEGLLLPPVRLATAAGMIADVEAIVRANSRTPDLVVGDLRGQIGATKLGADRVRELCRRYGRDTVIRSTQRLLDITERRLRAAVSRWPDGRYEGSSLLHNDGMEGGQAIAVRVQVTVAGDRISFDFSATDEQASGPYNIRPPLVQAVCCYALKCLVDPDTPANGGFARAIGTTFRPGTLVDPLSPAPVNTYMPAALVTTEAVLDALGKAVPAAQLAESSAGTNGTLAYEVARGVTKVQYELPAGAIGARYDKDGVSASKAHVANGSLMPVEIIESEFPVEVVRFDLVPDSGGAGRFRGGLGYVREYRVLAPATFTSRSGKELTPPGGRAGGRPGRPSLLLVNPGTDREAEVRAQAGTITLQPGDVLRVSQAGGGGFGDPRSRPAEEVLRDVHEGYVTVGAAREEYGVAVVAHGREYRVDPQETARLRAGAH